MGFLSSVISPHLGRQNLSQGLLLSILAYVYDADPFERNAGIPLDLNFPPLE